MSYRIIARVFQSNTSAFQVAEKTVWNYANGGTWAGANGLHVITMGGSGTSGTLRFVSEPDNKIFLLALGIHDSKVWTDIIPNLKDCQTSVVLHPEYYEAGTSGNDQREKQLSEYSVTNSEGHVISVKCAAVGNNGQSFGCNIIIE